MKTQHQPVRQIPRFPHGPPVRTLFEDQAILVVDKPAGLLTIATDREKNRTLYATLYEYVKKKRPPERIFIVHRLDREASGLLVFAKSEAGKRSLQQQFKERSAGRTYVAVVDGRMEQEQLRIESYLAENIIHRSYSTANRARGKRAVTHVTVLKRTSGRTLVEVQLETGRKHQIRVHLAEQGHPVVGDRGYDSSGNPIRRLALHATQLTFRHPSTGRVLTFHSPPPESFAGLV